jgi:hypothetical protein
MLDEIEASHGAESTGACHISLAMYKIFVRKLGGKKLLSKPRYRWKDNIRMDLGKVGWKGVDWLHVVEDRDKWQALLNVVMNLKVP